MTVEEQTRRNRVTEKYLTYLQEHRGARISFFIGSVSWLVAFAVHDIFELCLIIFPSTTNTRFVQAADDTLFQITNAISSIFGWYPWFRHKIGIDLSGAFRGGASYRLHAEGELVIAFATMIAFSVLLGVLGTLAYETGRRIRRER